MNRKPYASSTHSLSLHLTGMVDKCRIRLKEWCCLLIEYPMTEPLYISICKYVTEDQLLLTVGHTVPWVSDPWGCLLFGAHSVLGHAACSGCWPGTAARWSGGGPEPDPPSPSAAPSGPGGGGTKPVWTTQGQKKVSESWWLFVWYTLHCMWYNKNSDQKKKVKYLKWRQYLSSGFPRTGKYLSSFHLSGSQGKQFEKGCPDTLLNRAKVITLVH